MCYLDEYFSLDLIHIIGFYLIRLYIRHCFLHSVIFLISYIFHKSKVLIFIEKKSKILFLNNQGELFFFLTKLMNKTFFIILF